MQIEALILLIETILFGGFSILAFLKTIRLTRNIAYIHIGIGCTLGVLTSIFTSLASFHTQVNDMVILYSILCNVSISLSLLSIFNGLIFINENKLPIFSYIASLLVGATIILITDIDASKLTYTFDAIWAVEHDSILMLIFAILTSLIFFVYFVLYLIRKFYKLRNNKRVDLSFFAFLLLLFWVISAYIYQLKVVRMFILPIVFLLLGLTVFVNPLSMLATNKLPDEIILVTKYRQPLVRYNFIERKIIKNLEEVQLLIAGKKIISESLKSIETPKTLKTKFKEISVIDLKDHYCILIGRKIDSNSISATKIAFREFSNKTDLSYVKTTNVLNVEDEELFEAVFQDNFKRINGMRREFN